MHTIAISDNPWCHSTIVLRNAQLDTKVNRRKISTMYMDHNEFFAKNEKELEILIQTVRI